MVCCLVDVSDGIKVRLKLSASDILRVADQIISTSSSVHDAVAAVPLDQVCQPCLAVFLVESHYKFTIFLHISQNAVSNCG